jgi:hypothetical protein
MSASAAAFSVESFLALDMSINSSEF